MEPTLSVAGHLSPPAGPIFARRPAPFLACHGPESLSAIVVASSPCQGPSSDGNHPIAWLMILCSGHEYLIVSVSRQMIQSIFNQPNFEGKGKIPHCINLLRISKAEISPHENIHLHIYIYIYMYIYVYAYIYIYI